MSTHDVDLIVIGGGSGGVRAGRIAAEHGARVVVIEGDRWGGTCVIRGCVPKKLLVYASEASRAFDDARGSGWQVDATFDWASLRRAKDKEVARLSSAYATRLVKAGVELVEGRARIVEPHTVEVGGRRITGAHLIVATGGRPRFPAGGRDGWITSDDAFELERLPSSIAIAGGGYIGVEFAHIFAGLGVRVQLHHRGDRVLRGFDADVRDEVQRGLVAHGIDVRGNVDLEQLQRAACGDAELAMAALGRIPNIEGLGLEDIGVRTDPVSHAVIVDEWSRTSVPHIHAIGDVTNRVCLTPVAIREGHAVADTLFGGRPTPIHHELIPTAVFAQPPAACIGLTEAAAGADARVVRTRFRPMRYAMSGRDEHVLIKVIARRSDDRVVGLHVVGPEAPEIVQAAAIAVTMGATTADLNRTFAMHPTTAEELVLLR